MGLECGYEHGKFMVARLGGRGDLSAMGIAFTFSSLLYSCVGKGRKEGRVAEQFLAWSKRFRYKVCTGGRPVIPVHRTAPFCLEAFWMYIPRLRHPVFACRTPFREIGLVRPSRQQTQGRSSGAPELGSSGARRERAPSEGV